MGDKIFPKRIAATFSSKSKMQVGLCQLHSSGTATPSDKWGLLGPSHHGESVWFTPHCGIRLVGSGVQFWQEPSLLLFLEGEQAGGDTMSLSFKCSHMYQKKFCCLCWKHSNLWEILQSMIYKQTNIKADFTYSMDTILLGEKDSYKCLKRFYRFLKVHQYQLWPSWFTSQMYNVLDTIRRQTIGWPKYHFTSNFNFLLSHFKNLTNFTHKPS